MKPNRQFDFFDAPKRQQQFRTCFYICLVILLLIDLTGFFFMERQGHFPWEKIPFFNAVYGFMACVALIFIAKILRWFVRRKEDYYD